MDIATTLHHHFWELLDRFIGKAKSAATIHIEFDIPASDPHSKYRQVYISAALESALENMSAEARDIIEFFVS